jgi:predicted kinase
VKGKKQKKVTLLWGLPGSGKTTYAEECIPPRTRQARSVDVDMISRHHRGPGLVHQVATEVIGHLHYYEHIIIDGGPITTNEEAREIMMEIQTHPANTYDIYFEIVWWTPDREACKHNDRGRRALSSRVTIDHALFEEPSPELAAEFGISENRIVRKRVYRKPDWKV